MGGLGNRILTISSFVTYCKKMNYRLRIIWGQDKGLLCPFSELFSFSEEEPIEVKEIPGWKRFVYDYPRKSVLWLSPVFQYFIFDKRIYLKEFNTIRKNQDPEEELTRRIGKANSVYIVGCCDLHKEKRVTLPKLSGNVAKTLQEITTDFTPDTIGVHIRRTDNVWSIRDNHLELYVERMNKELENNPATNFYVASDSMEEKIKLNELFPKKIITSMKEIRRDSRSDIIFALAEMYALAETRKIIGSRHSTFAIVAGKLSEGSIDLF
jgi:hypothetical protein